MASTTAADIPVIVVSPNASSERRVNPSWTIAHLKTRLEPITGIPSSHQRLHLKIASQPLQALSSTDEESQQLAAWALQPYAEIQVVDTRPAGVRENYTDTSNVEKFTLPIEEYEARTDSVLAWKKAQKLGRFDPDAPQILQEKADASFAEVEQRGIQVQRRCRLLPASDHRRGVVAYVGEVSEIPGGVGAWVGVVLDEPTGKNDGSISDKRYFDSKQNFGVFVRPERVEVGDFPALSLDDELGEDDEF